jgi:ribosome-binding protein aMBF1 (putative translation factor)
MIDKAKISKKAVDFDDYLAEKLKDAQFRKYYEEAGKQLEIAYGILRARKAAGISQATLARKIGTTQGNIARMESGQQNFTTKTLQKIAAACGRELKIELVK